MRQRKSRGRKERRDTRQQGMSLIELMIALTVLAVGLIGLLALILSAIATNNRNRADTGATFLAAMVMEQIVNQPASTNPSLTLTDCAGNVRTVNTLAGGATLFTSSTAPSPSQVDDIDFTQAINSVPAGYRMSYATCDANGNQATYDVRWNVAALITSGTTNMSKTVTVGARPLGAMNTDIKLFAPPVTLRSITTN